MWDHNDRMEFVRSLILMEEGLSQLYKIFSQCFPEMRDFWTILSAEEAAHAEWVRILEAKVREGEAQFSDRGASLDLLLVEVRKLEQRIGAVEEKSCSLMDALSMAKEFESSMIERDFFKYFEGESKQVEDTLSRLSAQTREHLDRIIAVFNITRKPLHVKPSHRA